MPKTTMTVEFQGRTFPVYNTATDDTPNSHLLKVMYLNRTRNIAGTVKAMTTDRLLAALKVQARCCATGDGEDVLEPRP